MSRHQGIWREVWDTCQRCGFPHPVSYLITQKGIKLCTCHGCVDDLTIERRDRVIAETLANGEELATHDAAEKLEGDNEELGF